MNPVNISLYGILDPEHCLGRSLGELARVSAENGVSLIQYRDKKNTVRAMVDNARAIKHALADFNVPLIINDRVDVALACEAEGVHLGQQDMHVSDARRILGEAAIIGISIKTIEEAATCPVNSIDYAFVGGVFETQSKENPTAIGINGWMERANIIKNMEYDLPVGAIAGIDASNAGSLIEVGCEGVAVISALYKAGNVASATMELSRIVNGGAV